MQRNRIEVKYKDEDGKEVVVYATRPSPKQLSDAQMVAGKILKAGMRDKDVLMRHQLRDYLVQQGLWSEEQEKLVDKLNEELVADLTKLKAGGIKLSEAKDIAVKIRATRRLKLMVEMQRLNMDEFTLEAMAENARFDYLVSVCCKNEVGTAIFESVDDYKSNAEEEYARELASAMSQLVHQLEPNWEAELPENKFLIKHKFVDEKLRLVNKDGHYVTADGKKVDEDFNYIDDNGNIIDEHSVKIDKNDGLPLVESKPFLDDDGNPVE